MESLASACKLVPTNGMRITRNLSMLQLLTFHAFIEENSEILKIQ